MEAVNEKMTVRLDDGETERLYQNGDLSLSRSVIMSLSREMMKWPIMETVLNE